MAVEQEAIITFNKIVCALNFDVSIKYCFNSSGVSLGETTRHMFLLSKLILKLVKGLVA